MYPVSEDYLDTIESGSVKTNWHGSIKATNGVIYSFTEDDIVQGSGKITRQVCAGEDIEIGSTCAARLDISLYLSAERYELYDAQITLYFSLKTGNSTWEEVPIGIFYVTDPPERAMGIITLHAYDAMQKFDQNFGANLIGNPYYMLNYACNACGVDLGVSQSEIANMPNGTVETYTYEEIKINTYRELVGFIASYLGGYAYIGFNGQLYIKQYDMEVVRDISQDWRYEYKPRDYETYYTGLTAYFAPAQEMEYFTTGEPGGLTYELGTNPLIQFNLDETRKAVLNNILTTLAAIKYTPFTAKVPCDPSLMPGDVLNFTGNHAVDGKLSAITKQTITIKGSMTLECAGSDPGLSLNNVQKEIQAAASTNNKDGMYYYDYVNVENIHIDDGESAVVMLFNYVTTKATHVDFHGEIKCEVDTTEIISDDEEYCYENDGELQVTYSLGGSEVTDYYPVDTFTDGVHLLHLLYFFWASANIRGAFTVSIKCVGCSVDIEMGYSRGYIAGCGLAGDTAWDGSIYVYDDYVRRDFSSVHKNFTEDVESSFINPTSATALETVMRRNFFSTILKGFTNTLSQIAKLHRFTVENADEMTYDNAVVSEDEDVWVVNNTSDLGLVTTPDCAVSQIVTITSRHLIEDVTYIVSFDGGTTWWMYANGWVTPDYTLEQYGMVEGTMRSITQAQWAEKLNGTIMVRAVLIGNAELADIQIYTEVM